MSSKREKEVILNMLAIYKDMPQLWNRSHKDYKNKNKRNDGFRVLLQFYNSFDQDASVRYLKKKIDNLKTSYYKEAKKVLASQHEEDFYVPTLWYYDALSFLGSPPTGTEAFRTTVSADPLKYEPGQESSSSSDEERSNRGSDDEVPVPIKKRKTLLKQDDVLNTIEKLVGQGVNRIKEEEWEVYGKSIGLQMRDLKNKELTIAQKLIADVIYYAKIGKLTEDAQVVLS